MLLQTDRCTKAHTSLTCSLRSFPVHCSILANWRSGRVWRRFTNLQPDVAHVRALLPRYLPTHLHCTRLWWHACLLAAGKTQSMWQLSFQALNFVEECAQVLAIWRWLQEPCLFVSATIQCAANSCSSNCLFLAHRLLPDYGQHGLAPDTAMFHMQPNESSVQPDLTAVLTYLATVQVRCQCADVCRL